MVIWIKRIKTTVLFLFFLISVTQQVNDVCDADSIGYFFNGLLRVEEDDIDKISNNSRVRVNCKPGYVALGDPSTVYGICVLSSGVNWTLEGDIVCEPVSCSNPGEIQNGIKQGSVYRPGHSVNYTCNVGYRLVGSSTSWCLSNGTWSSRLPNCTIVTCPRLDNPPNGFVKSAETNAYQSVAEYKCREKFKLVGHAKRECLANGTWSGDAPSCTEIMCPYPKDPPYGKAIVLGNRTGDKAIYTCTAGGPSHSVECGVSGAWSKEPPLCPVVSTTTTTTPSSTTPVIQPKDCRDLGDIANGERYGVAFRPNSTIAFTCNSGYILNGPANITCMQGGQWKPSSQPTCSKPRPVALIVGCSVGGVLLIVVLVVAAYFGYRHRKYSHPGQKLKASPTDARNYDEIKYLGKPIPVTSL